MYKRADYFRFHTGNSDDSETSSSSETGSSEDSSRSDTPAETAERDPKKGGESSAKGKPGGIGTPAKAEGVTEGKEKSDQATKAGRKKRKSSPQEEVAKGARPKKKTPQKKKKKEKSTKSS